MFISSSDSFPNSDEISKVLSKKIKDEGVPLWSMRKMSLPYSVFMQDYSEKFSLTPGWSLMEEEDQEIRAFLDKKGRVKIPACSFLFLI